MKQPHTPGPWIVNDACEISAAYLSGGQYEYRKVCTVWTDWKNGIGGNPIEVKQANARLIKESPELLKACKGAQSALRKALPFLPPDTEAAYCGEWLDEINEVINRIEGDKS